MEEFERNKVLMNCPCVFSKWSGHCMVTIVPLIDCDMNCKCCGHNPTEIERRINTGRWVETNGVKQIRFIKRR